MKEKLDFYESILREYPEVITKNQFYRIAHISKATALFLLQSGKVPCKDSGKKTRRYKISTDDVILYRTDNLYAVIQREIKEKEELQIDRQQQKDGKAYEEEPYINEDEEPDIAEDDETQNAERRIRKKSITAFKNCDGHILSSTRPSKGNRGCSDA